MTANGSAKLAKSILFVAPEFFHYHEQIRRELIAQGHTVYFVADRPSKQALIKILIRKFRFLLGTYLRRHYRRVFAQIPENIDEVFIIKGEALTPAVMRAMKARFQQARFQLYIWDSLRNSKSLLSLVPFMDRVFTFDLNDSRAHPGWQLLPNFYVNNFSYTKGDTNSDTTTGSVDSQKDSAFYNLAFIGTAHSDRLEVLAKTSDLLPKNFSFYRFVFFQSPLLYYFRKIFDRSFSRLKPNEINLKPKPELDWEQMKNTTVALLDIHHPRQSGCSHRAIKCLAMGMKLVTTNANIRDYPFYDERLVYIIDRDKPRIDPDFLRTRADCEPPPAIASLELTNWLGSILN